MSRLAFVGLGSMGSPMARRLVAAGHDVAVWNRSPGKVQGVTALGATTAATPAGACEGAELVITMLADAEALDAVTHGPQGVLAGVSAGSIVVEMSTIGARAIARLAMALPKDLALVDAPVLGSVREAEEGCLLILAGGTDEAIREVRPTLSVLGELLHVGPSGTGALAKLVANTALFGVLGILGETVALGRRMGLADDQIFSVLAHSPLAAQATRRREAIGGGEQPTRFALALARKDADLAMDEAGEGGRELPMLRACRGWLAEAERSGLGGQDYTAVLTEILRSSSLPARSDGGAGTRLRSASTVAPRRWGAGCEAWGLVDDPGCSVVEEAMEPATAEEWHVHDASRQLFYVLSGALAVRTPDSQVDLRVGDGLEVREGTAHQVANTSGDVVRFLVVSHPSVHHDRRHLVAPVSGDTGPPPGP